MFSLPSACRGQKRVHVNARRLEASARQRHGRSPSKVSAMNESDDRLEG